MAGTKKRESRAHTLNPGFGERIKLFEAGRAETGSHPGYTSWRTQNDPMMQLLDRILAAVVLVNATLILQCIGMAALIEWARAHLERQAKEFGPFLGSLLIVRLTGLIICMHLVEVLPWAWFYRWKCLPTWESALYFSLTSYSTVGYGDVVLRPDWRMIGPLESITGVLMCGLSTAFLFTVVVRLVTHDGEMKGGNA